MRPFLSGVTVGALLVPSFLLVMHSASTLWDRNWDLFFLQFLWAFCGIAVGLSYLFTVLEIRK